MPTSSLVRGLNRTRHALADNLAKIFSGVRILDQKIFTKLEAKLLTADVGVAATQELLEQLQLKFKHEKHIETGVVLETIKTQLENILQPCEQPLVITKDIKPFVILLVGVNGSGKTTTIGKLAKKLQNDGHRVMLAAGDTFRAAAATQLKIWGERNGAPVIAQQPGADSAAVIFDALQAARARGVDVLIADTAGRLHTHDGFMAELKKVKRILQKIDTAYPQEVLLVLEVTTGQNALNQVKQFSETVGVTGMCLTKLDGTAKGGAIFAIAKETKIPIRFVGVGEGIEDLRPFAARDFVSALFGN